MTSRKIEIIFLAHCVFALDGTELKHHYLWHMDVPGFHFVYLASMFPIAKSVSKREEPIYLYNCIFTGLGKTGYSHYMGPAFPPQNKVLPNTVLQSKSLSFQLGYLGKSLKCSWVPVSGAKCLPLLLLARLLWKSFKLFSFISINGVLNNEPCAIHLNCSRNTASLLPITLLFTTGGNWFVHS